ncbi:MAG: efflux RND transporter periplasmic adaptor subunit [Planctomycetota bacterium]
MPTHRLLRTALLLTIGLLLTGGARPVLAQGRATPVLVEPVRAVELQARRMVTGELRAVRRSSVAAQEPGVVTELPVREGQLVEPGATLARLDARRLQIMLDQVVADSAATAALQQEREAELTWKQRDLDLLQASFDRGAANRRELEDAETQVAVARARVLQIQGQVDLNEARAELLRQRLEDTVIVAPFRGVVVARHVELGEWLGEGDPVVELVSAGPIEVWLDVPQRLLAPVREIDLPVSVVVEATGGTVEAKDRRIVPVVDVRARTFTLVARLDNEDDHLSPGMSVTAWVPTAGMAEHLVVPKNAVLRNEVGSHVFVARASGESGHAAMPVPVQVLFGEADWFAVSAAGLVPDDLVVVEGNERLFPMMPVAPVRGGDAAAGGAG